MTKDEMIKALQECDAPGDAEMSASIKFIDNYGEVDCVNSGVSGLTDLGEFGISIDTMPYTE